MITKNLYDYKFKILLLIIFIYECHSLLNTKFHLSAQPVKNFKKNNFEWKINIQESTIQFEIPLLIKNIKGEVVNFKLRNFYYKGYYNSLKNSELWIPVKDITTHNFYKDNSIQSEYFLNEKQYPYIKIKVLKLIPFNIQEDYFFIDYEIQIKEIKKTYKEIILLKQSWNKIEAKGEILLPRHDFSLYGNLILNLFLKDYIKISFYIIINYTNK